MASSQNHRLRGGAVACNTGSSTLLCFASSMGQHPRNTFQTRTQAARNAQEAVRRAAPHTMRLLWEAAQLRVNCKFKNDHTVGSPEGDPLVKRARPLLCSCQPERCALVPRAQRTGTMVRFKLKSPFMVMARDQIAGGLWYKVRAAHGTCRSCAAVCSLCVMVAAHSQRGGMRSGKYRQAYACRGRTRRSSCRVLPSQKTGLSGVLGTCLAAPLRSLTLF